MNDWAVWELATVDECWRQTGKKPIRGKWVDVNMGDTHQPDVRSCYVAREIATYKSEQNFAATPPLEFVRAIINKAAARTSASGAATFLQMVDVSRAHFYADAVRDVFIQLPPEDEASQDSQKCGKLLKTMYGTLDAAERWALHYGEVLKRAGYVQGKASPSHYWHPEYDTWLLVHGDDFFSAGDEAGQEHLLKTIASL